MSRREGKESTKRKGELIVKPYREERTANMVYTGRFKWWSPKRKYKALPLKPLVICLMGHMNENSFRSCVVQLINPKVTVHIYTNGKFTVCGAKTAMDAITATHMVMATVAKDEELGILLEMYRFKLDNVVVAFSPGYAIDIAAFRYHNQWNTFWNPGKYIGLQHYPKWPATKPCYVIHDTGATNGVGTESHDAAVIDFDCLKLHLYQPGGELSNQFKKESSNSNNNKRRRMNLSE